MDLSTLNAAQVSAVKQVDGPILVLAGAGSGKTRVLTHRIASLIEVHDVFPSNILAITFTNKAASEMKERIERLIGPISNQMWIGTFHAICVRILRRDGDRIGFGSDFVIYDTADQRALLKNCYKTLEIDDKRFPMKTAQYKISNAKNDMLSPDQYEKEFGGDFSEKQFIEIYKQYQKVMKQNQAMDFDDILLNTIALFKAAPDVLEVYQKRFRYIHVDEYQDTNRAQYLLIRLLASKHHNLFVVGDGDQSIYKWRGADIRNIREFEIDYPGAKLVKLEQNYRSSKNILDLANSVIQHNPNRKDKNLWTDRGEGDKVKYYKAYDEKDEANNVIREMKKLIQDEGYKISDFAVLYRTNAQSRPFEDCFLREDLSYRIVGGMKFYERKEIKDIMAYLKLIVNPYDDVSFRRVINEPKRAIGDRSIEKLSDYAISHGLSLLEASGIDEARELVGGKAKLGLKTFYDIIEKLRAMMATDFVSQIFDTLMDETGIIRALEVEKTIEADSRIDNLYEFKNVVEEFEKRNSESNLRDFLAETTLRSDQDSIENDEEGALMMTIHASKGLEFPVVFLVGLEDNLFPSFRSVDDPEALEEERRLCYVGITRAEQRLYVSHAMNRTQFGRYEPRYPSCFLSEMDPNCIEGMDESGIEKLKKDEPKQSYFSIGKSKITSSQLKPASHNPFKRSNSGMASGNQIPQSPKASGDEFGPGDKVKHKIFGFGTVISLNGSTLTIAFEKQGIKKLDMTIAPLKKMEM